MTSANSSCALTCQQASVVIVTCQAQHMCFGVQAELNAHRQAEGVEGSEASWDQHAVQGTSTSLEKKYFRLTGPPDTSTVRPAHVLKAALQRVVKQYRAGQCDVHYAEDQLKAMRQDATVQHIKGQLPVQIYEAHARLCLEHGNGGDFNQCQTVLKQLYEEGCPGCVQEFVAYRVMYQSILRSKESASLLATLEHLSPQVSLEPMIPCLHFICQALLTHTVVAKVSQVGFAAAACLGACCPVAIAHNKLGSHAGKCVPCSLC